MNQSRAMRIVAYPVTAILMAALAAVVLFAACFVYETEKKVAFWAAAAIVAICVTPQFRRRLRERCSIFFLLVTAYILLAGASTFYAYAPKFALSEFSRLLAAYAVFLAVFSFAKRETLPNAAAVLCGATSLLSLLHLDAASGGLFAHDIIRKFQLWTAGGYTQMTNGAPMYGYGVSVGRLSGLFGNSNSMATMCAIGIFLALYLLLRAKGFRRLLPCAALVINTVTFLMCISLGATLSMGVTVLIVVLCLHGAQNRLSFLLVTLETLAISGALAALSFPHMGTNVPTGYLVLVYCAIGWLVLFALDYLLRPRLVNFLCKKIKIICIFLAALVVLLAASVIPAFSQPTSVTLQSGELLPKRFSPGSGSFEMSIELEGSAKVWIASASQAEILTKTTTTLYTGPYDGAISLDIPEDAIEIQMWVSPAEDTPVTVKSLSYTGTQKSDVLPAGYRFLPQEILNRLQGLTTNHSAMQRIVFMQDGLKMWRQTPLFGRGLGGYENGLASVQNFFYETKYAHNHYVQALCDLGLVGLLLFVSMLGFAVYSLWSLRRKGEAVQALFPALLGAVVVFAVHGGLEISASTAEVSILAFGAFGLVAHLAPVPASFKNHGQAVALTGSIVLGLLAAVYGFLLYQNARAAEIVNQDTVTTSQLKQCVEMDVFEGDDYRLTYVVAAMSIQDEEVYQQADIYADQLQQGNSNAVGSYLTEYYLHRGDYEKAKVASDKFLVYTRSNVDSWDTQFHTFETAMLNGADPEQMEQIVLHTYEQFQTVYDQQLEHLSLNVQSLSFMTRILATENTVAQRVASLLLDSRYIPDLDGDGCPDTAMVTAGSMTWDGSGGFTNTFSKNSSVKYQVVPMQSGTYTFTVETDSPDQLTPIIENMEYQVFETDHSVTLQFDVSDAMVGEALQVTISLKPGISVDCVFGERTG